MARTRKQRTVAGVSLIAVGVALLILQQLEIGIGAAAVFFVIGAAFLAAYFYYRAYGMLIPACILLGLGVGMTLTYGSVPLGLGCGFLAITAIALLYEKRFDWWPLIPGGVLVLVGLPDTRTAVRWLLDQWPVLLIVIGVLILLGAFRGTGPRTRADTND